MKLLVYLLLILFSISSEASKCLYENDLHGLTPNDFLILIESGKTPVPAIITLKTWLNTSYENRKKLVPHIRILGSDCQRTSVYQDRDGHFYPVKSKKIQAPFGDLYSLYASAVMKRSKYRINWLYEYTVVQPKSLGSYLKLWRLVPPVEVGGLEVQKLLMNIFKKIKNLKPKSQDIVDETARNWDYTGVLDDFNFPKLFKAMGGVVLPDCGPYPLPNKYEAISAVKNKRPYQSAIDLMMDLQGFKVVPVEGDANLVKIPLGSTAQVFVDFKSCI